VCHQTDSGFGSGSTSLRGLEPLGTDSSVGIMAVLGGSVNDGISIKDVGSKSRSREGVKVTTNTSKAVVTGYVGEDTVRIGAPDSPGAGDVLGTDGLLGSTVSGDDTVKESVVEVKGTS